MIPFSHPQASLAYCIQTSFVQKWYFPEKPKTRNISAKRFRLSRETQESSKTFSSILSAYITTASEPPHLAYCTSVWFLACTPFSDPFMHFHPTVLCTLRFIPTHPFPSLNHHPIQNSRSWCFPEGVARLQSGQVQNSLNRGPQNGKSVIESRKHSPDMHTAALPTFPESVPAGHRRFLIFITHKQSICQELHTRQHSYWTETHTRSLVVWNMRRSG